jgi:hypothetical protein
MIPPCEETNMSFIKQENDIVMIPACGHHIPGDHIEKPVLLFKITWTSLPCELGRCNGGRIVWPHMQRYAFCKAETIDGAVKIAKHHHGTNGTDFNAVEVDLFD